MNEKRRNLRILIAAILILSLTMTGVFAGELENFSKTKKYPDSFIDVKASDWFVVDIINSNELGLFVGKSDTSFDPYGNITLAEAITLVSRVNSIYKNGTSEIADNGGSEWHSKFVEYGIANGLFRAGEFSSYDIKATRAQLAYLFYNSIDSVEFTEINSINSLPDVNGNTVYNDEILSLYKAGVLVGNDAYGTFNPMTNISRAEAAAIINRVVNKGERKEVTLSLKPTAPVVNPSLTAEQKQAVEDITVALGTNTYDYKAVRGDFEGEDLIAFDRDYEQLITNPYSSPHLTEYFNVYIKSHNISLLISDCGAWLMNGGDDGVAHTKLD